MSTAPESLASLDGELRSASMTAQLLRFWNREPLDRVLHDTTGYWLDLSVTPRPRHPRGCYLDHWSPHRFERMGKIFLVPPGKRLRVRNDGGEQQLSIVCRIPPHTMDDRLGDGFSWTDRALEASLNIQNANILALLQRLAREIGHPGPAGRRLLELIAEQLALELGRYFDHVNHIPASGGLSPWRLKLIDERLRDLRTPPTLAELATLCKLSTRQLTHGFRASRGCSVGTYIANKRIAHAKHLLATGQAVNRIADTLGYASASSFSQAFRRATGATPREFRNRALRLIQAPAATLP